MSSTATLAFPRVVSEREWPRGRSALLAKEEALAHARDALAAEGGRLPMVRVDKEYLFEGPEGKVSLLDPFHGRPQLLLCHFMFAPGVHGWALAGCPGCAVFS